MEEMEELEELVRSARALQDELQDDLPGGALD